VNARAELTARRVLVDGRVQGVGFRWRTQQEAQALGVGGWVRNLPDGSVEAHVQGEPPAVEALVAWLRQGPSHARVLRCEVVVAELESARGLEIRA
jgi:acylphosphatase